MRVGRGWDCQQALHLGLPDGSSDSGTSVTICCSRMPGEILSAESLSRYCNGHYWARTKSGIRSSVQTSRMNGREADPWATLHRFPRPLTGNRTGIGAHMRCWHSRQWPYLVCHNAGLSFFFLFHYILFLSFYIVFLPLLWTYCI